MIAVLRTSSASAGPSNLLVDQQPAQVGGAYSDTQFVSMFGQSLWQQEADRFQLPNPSMVAKVVVWGFYGPEIPNPPANETMRLRFYGSRIGDGLPGSVIHEELFTNASRVPTGEIVLVFDGPREFKYTFDLASPLAFNAATPYWIEVVQIGDPSSSFLWESSGGGDFSHAYLNPFVADWTQSNGSDHAFQLFGVPEPASIVLLGEAMLSAVSSRRRSTIHGT